MCCWRALGARSLESGCARAQEGWTGDAPRLLVSSVLGVKCEQVQHQPPGTSNWILDLFKFCHQHFLIMWLKGKRSNR